MPSSEIEKNQEEFWRRYSLEKKNYNIIIAGIDGCGKHNLVELIIREYFQKNNFELNYEMLKNPDIYRLSIPLYDRSGKIIRITNSEERLLYRLGFEDKIEGNRIGTEITVDQIRSLSKFVCLSSRYNHKFIIVNNAEDLNKEATAAMLKTLEETNTASIFFLLTDDVGYLPETIKSRCHTFNFFHDESEFSDKNFLDYFLSLRPNLVNILKDKNYMNNYNEIENELSLLFQKKIDPLILSDKWNSRGIFIIDYLISFFNLLLKGNFLHKHSQLKKIYLKVYEKISVQPIRSIEILKSLLEMKKYNFSNLNQKFYFDNLLIVLNKNLY